MYIYINLIIICRIIIFFSSKVLAFLLIIEIYKINNLQVQLQIFYI